MVLCTDGLANVGLGALDDLRTDDERAAVETFYEKLGREVQYSVMIRQENTAEWGRGGGGGRYFNK